MFELVAVAGSNKGHFWPITEDGLVVGRGHDCDIRIQDPMVSRRHCRISLQEERIHIEDLGARNTALVNGIPVEQGPLMSGDELAIGRHVFLLVSAEADSEASGRYEEPDTRSWTSEGSLFLEADAESAKFPRPTSVQELAKLHGLLRGLGQCGSVHEFATALHQVLCDHFRPDRVWLARVQGEDELTFDHGRSSTAPLKAIHQALRERRGMLVPSVEEREEGPTHLTTVVAPWTLSGVNQGIMAIQRDAQHGSYHEGDLRFFISLAAAVAPFKHAMECMDQLRLDNERLRAQAVESPVLVGESRGVRRVRRDIARASKSDLNVLITGSTGTGKELAARTLHSQSNRRNGPLVVVNCAAIPRELFEGEFFGHEKGAFTGAICASEGLMAQAHGGTLFLDEIGDLSLDNQARILRAIEYGTFRRVGAEEETYVDFRVIAATNKQIGERIKEGAFREDLYHRLNGFEIHIPTLAERPSDIPILSRHFFELGKYQAKRPLRGISSEAMEYLRARRWPGNVRELRSCILRAISIASNEEIQVRDVSLGRHRSESEGGLPLSLMEVERQHIASVLDQCGGNVRNAARILGIGRSTLYNKVSEYGLQL